jgi:hypothetical protein
LLSGGVKATPRSAYHFQHLVRLCSCLISIKSLNLHLGCCGYPEHGCPSDYEKKRQGQEEMLFTRMSNLQRRWHAELEKMIATYRNYKKRKKDMRLD